VKAAIEALDNVGTVSVTRTVAGGPSVTFTVTFTEDLGDVDELACTYGAGSCTPSTTQSGNFLDGDFQLTIGAYGNTAAIDVAASATTLRNAITVRFSFLGWAHVALLFFAVLCFTPKQSVT